MKLIKKKIFRKDRQKYETVILIEQLCVSNCGKVIKIQKGQLNKHSGKCRSCSKIGSIPWNKGKSVEKMSNEKSPNWKGGTYISYDGYRQIKVPGKKAYKREHTLEMEKSIGRQLNRGEVVHHIDGDKLNNRISNLFLCNNSEHRLIHASLEQIAFSLVKEGLIKFDETTKKYYKV